MILRDEGKTARVGMWLKEEAREGRSDHVTPRISGSVKQGKGNLGRHDRDLVINLNFGLWADQPRHDWSMKKKVRLWVSRDGDLCWDRVILNYASKIVVLGKLWVSRLPSRSCVLTWCLSWN